MTRFTICDLYTYLIDTSGQYAIESLKAYKSLEAYNYFYNGYSRHEQYACLKAFVNPSQKAPDPYW